MEQACIKSRGKSEFIIHVCPRSVTQKAMWSLDHSRAARHINFKKTDGNSQISVSGKG